MKKSHPRILRSAVTNEELARMIAGGFAQTATKQDIQGVDERLGGVEDGIAKLDERLGVVETKLDRALYTEITFLETRVKRLEEKTGIRK